MKNSFIQLSFAFFCCLIMGNALANPLRLTIEPSQTAGSVDVSLINASAETLSVLLWDTPFESTLSHDIFVIEKAVKGLPILDISEYKGRSVKRSQPTAEHYQTLQPGELISTIVKINDYYDIAQFGEYSVRFSGDIRYEIVGDLQPRSKKTLRSINTMSHAALQTDSVTVNLGPTLTPRLRPPRFDSCSVQERADIVEAANIAETLTNTAITDLQGLVGNERVTSPRYSEWFGTHTEARFNQVISNLASVGQAIENETLQFNCGCTDAGIFAFVFPAFPYSITLCPSFRDASPNGQDSRAGTIIHELSHFTVVAGTDDHVYGQSGARALAISNPDLVISNADSYEYFTENAPALPIRQAGATNPQITYPALQLGALTQGSVAQGEARVFEVLNANRVDLTSTAGDADLYIYRDDQLENEICRAASVDSPTDLCEIFVNGTVYVRVLGFSDATFTLRADGEARIVEDSSFELTLGVPVTGSVEANTRVIYRLRGGDVVELESLSGDADLYVFSGLDLTAGSLVCSSTSTPEVSLTDRCNIPSTQDTYYVTVVGYTAANYSLVARSTESENATRLIAGQTVSGNITAGSAEYFVIAGVDSIVLTSVTGDADLQVTSDSEFRANDTSCTSTGNSSITVTDTCVVTNGNDHYILVFGFSDASYTILGTPGNTPPNDDDPNARSGGGGIGASSGSGVLILLMFVGFRVRRKG